MTWSRLRARALDLYLHELILLQSQGSTSTVEAQQPPLPLVPARHPQDSGQLDQNGKVVQSLFGPAKHVPRRGGHAGLCHSIICDTESLIAREKAR